MDADAIKAQCVMDLGQVAADLLEMGNWARELETRVRGVLEAMNPVGRPSSQDFVVYSQRDPLWADDILGVESQLTIGQAGCAITAAAMICTIAGCEVTPKELNGWLQENAGYTRDNDESSSTYGQYVILRWERLPLFCATTLWRGMHNWRSKPANMEVVRDALNHGPVIAEVDIDPADRDIDQHFVVLLGFTGEDEIEIADPWDGDRVGLVEGYFNPAWTAPAGKCARTITGLRVLQPAM